MSGNYTTAQDYLRSTRTNQGSGYDFQATVDYDTADAYASLPLDDYNYAGRGNSQAYASAMQNAQGTYGNRALQRYLGQSDANEQSGANITSSMDPVSVQRLPETGAPGSTGSPVSAQGAGDMTWLGGGMWLEQGQTQVGGYGHPKDGTGLFGYYEDTPYQVSIPGLPDPTLHSFTGGFGMDVGGTTLLGGSATGGTWQDDEGGTRVGGKFNAGVLPGGQIGSMDGQFASVGGEASIGNDGFTLGGGVTVGGVGGTTGDTFDPNSTSDDSMHFGLSEGPSLGVRGHWGDSDGDGYREYGFGFDAGFVSFDAKSEDPLRTMLMGGPLNMLPDDWNPMSSIVPEKGNLTEGAIGMAGSAMDTLAGGLTSALDWASPMWMGESGGLDPIAPQQPGGGGGLEGVFPSF